MGESILKIRDLAAEFLSGEQYQRVVEGVNFDIHQGEAPALVGESGSGKSMTAHSVLRLLPYSVTSHPAGSIHCQDEDLLKLPERRLHGIRGNRIAVVFQEPITSPSPLYTIEKQLTEVLALHKGLGGAKASARILGLLELVGIPEPAKRLKTYPHELSDGQRQRVMIAMALACKLQLLTTGEPTAALDVTIQLKILGLLKDLRACLDMSLLLITHSLNLVQHITYRVCVVQQRRIIGQASCQELFTTPRHPYTRELLNAEPSGVPASNPSGKTLLTVDGLRVWFPIHKGMFRRTTGRVKAVDEVSFGLPHEQTLDIVDESGSSKSTLGLATLRLPESQDGIRFGGARLDGLTQHDMHPLRHEVQVVFQDPYGNLSPHMCIGETVGEGLRIHGIGNEAEQEQVIVDALVEVGLDPQTHYRYPHEFPGGQRQRITITQALVLKPALILLDEPISALDHTVQRQIVKLLRQLQGRYNLTYLFISHDLAVIKALSHQPMVVRHGKVVGQGSTKAIFASPQHPYTQQLLEAVFMAPASTKD